MYELYSDSTRQIVWGVGAGAGDVTEIAAPSASAVNYTVTARPGRAEPYGGNRLCRHRIGHRQLLGCSTETCG
jgi:spore coat protein U-like protein